MTQYIQIIILGLTLGGVFALMASGLTLIFGVMGIINLAHAAFIMVAAFMTFARCPSLRSISRSFLRP